MALIAKAALVDPTAFGVEGTAIATRIPRSEVEGALRGADGPMDLYLDVVRTGGEQPKTEHRITVSWEHDDLERLLQSATGDEVTLAFKAEDLQRMIEGPDVEAQGLRERAAVLTVAAATATGISAGAASAMHAPAQSEAAGDTAAFVTDTTSGGPVEADEAGSGAQFVTDTTSGGPVEAPEASGGTQFVTDTTSSGPGATEDTAEAGGTQFISDARGGDYAAPTEDVATGGEGDFLSTAGGEAALAGGVALLIAAAGFAATRQRRKVQPT